MFFRKLSTRLIDVWGVIIPQSVSNVFSQSRCLFLQRCIHCCSKRWTTTIDGSFLPAILTYSFCWGKMPEMVGLPPFCLSVFVWSEVKKHYIVFVLLRQFNALNENLYFSSWRNMSKTAIAIRNPDCNIFIFHLLQYNRKLCAVCFEFRDIDWQVWNEKTLDSICFNEMLQSL